MESFDVSRLLGADANVLAAQMNVSDPGGEEIFEAVSSSTLLIHAKHEVRVIDTSTGTGYRFDRATDPSAEHGARQLALRLSGQVFDSPDSSSDGSKPDAIH